MPASHKYDIDHDDDGSHDSNSVQSSDDDDDDTDLDTSLEDAGALAGALSCVCRCRRQACVSASASVQLVCCFHVCHMWPFLATALAVRIPAARPDFKNRVALVIDTLCCTSRLATVIAPAVDVDQGSPSGGALQLARILSADVPDAAIVPLLLARLRSAALPSSTESPTTALVRLVLHYCIPETDDDGAVVSPAWARGGSVVTRGTLGAGAAAGVGPGVGGAVEVRILSVALQAVKTCVELVIGPNNVLATLLSQGLVWYMLHVILSDAPAKYVVMTSIDMLRSRTRALSLA